MFCYNVNSLFRAERRTAFSNIMLLYNFDILCLCETWLTTEISDAELFLQNYTLYRSNRSAKEGFTSHGGTMVAIKSSISSDEIQTDYDKNGSKAACQVSLGNLSLCIVCIYSPPHDSKYTYTICDFGKLFLFLKKQQKAHNELIVYSDLNHDQINWNTLEPGTDREKMFLENIEDLNLQQKIDFKTSVTGILDLMLVTKNICDVVLEPLRNYEIVCNMSSHTPIVFTFTAIEEEIYMRKTRGNEVYSFCNADFDKIRDMMERTPFDSYCWSIVDVVLDNWYYWLEEILEDCVPRRTKHRSCLLPWISRETSHILKRLKTKRKRYHETHPSVQDLLIKSNAMAQEDKIRYESQLAATRSSANLFKYFKAFKKEKNPSKLKWGKEEAHSDAEKVRLFAGFFASTQEISNICSELPVNKSKLPDNLPPILFREVSEHISASLFQIFKKVFQTSSFPSVWKEAIVSPIYKKGSKRNAENYRPVSLLSMPSKIFERILFKRLFLHVRPYLHKAQYGFMPGRSTVLQLLVMLQKIYHGLENNLEVDIVLTDFSKAFDQVDHGILLRKIHQFHIEENLLRLLHSYLSGRSQRVRVENDAVEIKCWDKDLGLIVQNDLKWNRHIENACSKGFKIFYMIKRNVSNLP